MAADEIADSWSILPFGLAGARRRRRDHPVACWVATALMVSLAAMLRLAMGRALPAPFLPFYPAIMGAALLGGRPTGYAAVIASGGIAAYLFVHPLQNLAITYSATLALALFLVVGCVVVEILSYLGRRADLLVERQVALTVRSADLARREAETAASLSELEALYDRAPVGLGFLDRDLRFVRVNQTLADMNGSSPAEHIGRCVWEIVPDLQASAEPSLRRVLDTGETLTGIELIGETPARPGEKRHWIEMFYPVYGGKGEIHGVGICCSDVTDFRQAQERERLLTREVDHRAKNLLTVVQSVLHLTRSAETIEEYKAAVTGRIQALGRVHTILADNRWDGIPLADLARQELAPYGTAVAITGPGREIILAPSPGQALSMILHELATNSAKHGALSGDGRVTLDLSASDDRLTLRWAEHGGPAVEPQGRNGFGTSLIQTAVKRLLGGTLDFRLEATGLICEIAFPLPPARERTEAR